MKPAGDTPSPDRARAGQRRALTVALAANAALLVAQVVGGIVFGSLALLADAAHLLSDVAGLAMAVVAVRLVGRPATLRHSFGLQRAEVLGAQANAILLLGAAAWVFYEAAGRLASPSHVDAGGLIALAAVGLGVNGASAAIVARAGGRGLNMRAAFLHLAADSAASLGALVAGVVILVWHVDRADPIASIVIGAAVLWAGWGLLRDATHVLLEGTPRDIDPERVERFLATEPGVVGVHHLHLWNLASDVLALSAHVVLAQDASMHAAQLRGEELKDALARRFGIEHATLEMECHDCEPAPDELPRWPAGDRPSRVD